MTGGVNAMLMEVDHRDPTPVYEQIRGQMARMVAAGTLPAGTRLPTIRQLAADLGVAKGTVARAYEMLLRDGIAQADGRHGTVVAPGGAVDPRRRDRELLRAARSYAVEVRQLGVDDLAATRALRAALRELA